MDILVTTPKSQIGNAKKEGRWAEKNGGHWFRVFKFKPDVDLDDRIYFVENGYIRGFGVILHAPHQSADGETCEVTGKSWGKEGYWVVEYSNWHWLDDPIAFKGFQGIRYVSRLPLDIRNIIIREAKACLHEKL